MKKVILYLRVSDEMQAEKDSLIKQEEQAFKYCEFKGYKIHKVIKEVGSGRKNDREGFLELEAEIEKAEFDTLIFYELSRLARISYVIHKLVNSLLVNSISFESITEPHLNSDAPSSKLMLGFMAAMAEVESDTISKRVKLRMLHYASQGYWVFRPPLGYTLGKDKILYKNNEAEIIKEIFSKFMAGKSLTQLQQEYNKAHSIIKHILTNVAYSGKTKFGFEKKLHLTGKTVKNLEGEIFEGKHEAIIEQELFDLVQTRLNGITHSSTRANNSEHILSGIIKHKGCDWKAYGKKHTKDLSVRRYYSCSNCYKSIGAKNVEAAVIESAKEYVSSLSFLDEIPRSRKEFVDVNKKRNILISKKERIINAYMDNNISRDDYLKKVKNIENELLKLKEVVEVEEPNTISLKNKLISMFDNFDQKDIYEKKSILKLLIEEVLYDKKEITIIYKV
ncbi:MAG: recombinase family protein [Cetobacterium sp.]